MARPVRWTCLLLLPGLAGGLAPLGAQHLSLGEALERAGRAAYANRLAAAETRTRAAAALEPLKGVLPSLRLEGGYVRTTDPLNAFGFLLRQREVTQAAFAPPALNDPASRGNLATGLVVEQPLFNADALLGRRAARAAAAAAEAAERWTRTGTALAVVRAYYGAVLAAERVGTLEAAARAARAHVRQAAALVEQGLATRADQLLAEVKAGEVEADLIEARGRAGLARHQLAVAMGQPEDTAFSLPPALPEAPAVRALGGRGETVEAEAERADLQSSRLALQAAQADARRADALYLPRLNAFGRLDWNDPGAPFGGRPSWTVGVLLAWSPFAGGAALAEGRSARSRRAAAGAMVEAAAAQAALEVAEAEEALVTALAKLDIAERAVVQSREAHRIVSRKYDGGLASVTELFDAAAAETASGLRFAAARYDALVAVAGWRRARGLDLAPLIALDAAGSGSGKEAP